MKYLIKCLSGSFLKTLGRILCYLSIGGIIALLLSSRVHAAVTLNGTKLTLNNYVTVDYGNTVFNFDTGYEFSQENFPRYFLLTMCSDTDDVLAWFVNNRDNHPGMIESMNVFNSSYKCRFPNSTYTGGRIIYIYGTITPFGTVGSNFYKQFGGFTYLQPNYASWALLSYTPSIDPIEIDYSSNSIISQNQELINQQQTIINQQGTLIQQNNNLWNKQDEISKNQQQTNQKLDEQNQKLQETNDFLKDDSAPEADIGVLGNVQGLLPPGPVDSLLNIPFQFLSIIVSSFSGSCVPFTGKFVFDSTLTIPCFNDAFYNNVPPLLMNFLSLVPCAFILMKYFKHLYKKVDRAVSMDSNADDEWGVI